MKTLILFTFLSLLNMLGTESCNPPVSDPPCDSSFWTHTYGAMERFGDPSPNNNVPRTKLYHRCVNVRGRVDSVDADERDGDMKIKLSLFPTNFIPYGPFTRSDLLNYYNDTVQGGRLVVEIVCAVPVGDPNNHNAIAACMNYKNPVYIPKVGESVIVIGELVTDMGPCAAHPGPAGNCHGWKEIHPVTSIRRINL